MLKVGLQLSNYIIVDIDEMEHLLNCMDNQKFIHEQNEKTREEWQNVIDSANRKMRKKINNKHLWIRNV